MPNQPHSFYIPVMGTGFTIDTPLRIARYGISSVISMADDILIEQVRKCYCDRLNEPYKPISNREPDARARRITAYLNLVDRQVKKQVEALQASPFDECGDITRYFELLPESDLKKAYRAMQALPEGEEKTRSQAELRRKAVPGSIDVNIMTKLDADAFAAGEKLPPEFSSALAALRGYALSTLESSIVFSAGINQKLYSYAAGFEDFFPDAGGGIRKKITLKVSDYRSAVVQGKFLAKKGLWVSEFRVESGINCGGHAFANSGHLLGPILEEFMRKRQELTAMLQDIYVKALKGLGRSASPVPSSARLTVQGGIGTAEENEFLLKYYHVDATGWGTPFLLVPEATNMDTDHLEKLLHLNPGDVYLSDSSPLGVPFWSLNTSASENARRRRIEDGRPGSPCPKGYLALNTEFTQMPACPASRAFVRQKLNQLDQEALPEEQLAAMRKSVLDKACLCHDLAGGAVLNLGIDAEATPSICCGPNIVNFSKIASLEEMIGHIYGRLSLMTSTDRPHMFARELKLYIEQLKSEIQKFSLNLTRNPQGYFSTFKGNMLAGIDYYRDLARQFIGDQRDRFLEELRSLQQEIDQVLVPEAVKA